MIKGVRVSVQVDVDQKRAECAECGQQGDPPAAVGA
jgi:hypothetical protein